MISHRTARRPDGELELVITVTGESEVTLFAQRLQQFPGQRMHDLAAGVSRDIWRLQAPPSGESR